MSDMLFCVTGCTLRTDGPWLDRWRHVGVISTAAVQQMDKKKKKSFILMKPVRHYGPNPCLLCLSVSLSEPVCLNCREPQFNVRSLQTLTHISTQPEGHLSQIICLSHTHKHALAKKNNPRIRPDILISALLAKK